MRNRDRQTPDDQSFIIPEIIAMMDEMEDEDAIDHPSASKTTHGSNKDPDDLSEVMDEILEPKSHETESKLADSADTDKHAERGSKKQQSQVDRDIELLSLIKDKERLHQLLSAELVSKEPSAPSQSAHNAHNNEADKNKSSNKQHVSSDKGQKHAQSHSAQHESQSKFKKQGKSQQQGHAHGGQEEQVEPIPSSIDQYLKKLEDAGFHTSFDIVVREMTLGDKRTALFFYNGLVKDTVLTDVLTRLTYLQPDTISTNALHDFLHYYVPAVQVKAIDEWDDMLLEVMSGASAFYIDGENKAIIIDAKAFPSRGPEEPSLERVVRGARDGFVETLMVNVSLVRRRLRDPMLRYEIVRVGQRTQTDVCIAYVEDITDPELIESIRDKIQQVKLDGLPLADKQLEEATVKRGWNPYPLVRYSERPDVVAAHLLEGNVAVFVDTSPSVMLLPTTFFDLVQHAEENRQTPFMGTYLRWVRFIGIMASLFLLPIWFLFVLEPGLKPVALEFIGPTKTGKIPMVIQFLLAELGVDLLRMAAVHTPTPLATAMSLIAAIMIGDIAVSTGLFINEVILYMAVAAVGMFATPSYELGLANRIVRILLIVCVAVFKVPGFVIATTLVLLTLAMERSFNRPYMWPFIPFDLKAMINIIVRPPVLYNRTRPNLLRPKQRDKMPRS
ncbi:stage V sporulation protein AF [Paenibacillus cellulosilyticus]|uniref:Stage V sporulation protein AF n=1 Tax=Paenibacillus cellulosilyticus TaxID=375489 RepID=A0A2V2YWF9_9BACL|nr:stage V sporulation protein AF [Paenibacillus cellulosilyticus]QKS45356.1 spore germination protein [Paenibacillus cellulosilyticus]